MLFLDQPPESYSQRVKPESSDLSGWKSTLKNAIEDALEADDFLEFIDLLNPVIEFHNLKKFDNFDFVKTSFLFIQNLRVPRCFACLAQL